MKFTDDQLRDMAKTVMQDKQQGGDRWFHLVMVVSARTNIDPQEVMARIERMAA